MSQERPISFTRDQKRHRRAIWMAILVTLIWSSSWVLIKFGLNTLQPIGFAGMRYGIATLCLIPLVARKDHLAAIKNINPREWIALVLLGILFYSVAQGGQYLALARLPAVTVSLMLSMTAVVVVLLGILFLKEIPGKIQWIGIGLFSLGVFVYFYPFNTWGDSLVGMAFALAATLSTSVSSVLGRSINRDKKIPPIVVTGISMGIGSVLMLVGGFWLEGVPSLGWMQWLLIIWMAVVNTAFTFTLWNITLQSLTAMESSIINNTMLVQIAILAWVFLGESIDSKSGLGLVLVSLAVILVSLRGNPLKKIQS